MKVSLSGLLNNARSVIPNFEQSEGEDIYKKYQECACHCPASQLMDDHSIQMAGGISEFLRQTVDNINTLKKDPSQLAEFLELYSLPSIDDWQKAVEEKAIAAIKEIIITEKFRQFFYEHCRCTLPKPLTEADICELVAAFCCVGSINEIVSGSVAHDQWEHLKEQFRKFDEEPAAGEKDGQ